tara:strand:- start:165 stop:674 length:510 start_codon:yes stop_codon:yes gene_type:complete
MSNQLTSLDVSFNTVLTNLFCLDNLFTNLDVSSNTGLTDLRCGFNQLTILDVSSNTVLTNLSCDYNSLTSLNVANGKNTSMTMSALNNGNLTCIEVDDAVWSTANWIDIDSQTSFSEKCVSTLSINEYTSTKSLIKMFDIMGREATYKPNTLLIYLYDDGSTEKVLTVE